MVRRISSSRPMTGSSLPFRAKSVRSTVYFLSASRCWSASAESIPSAPRADAIAASSDLASTPLSRSRRPLAPLSCIKANKKSSVAINVSPRCIANLSAKFSMTLNSRPTCTSPPMPCTCGIDLSVTSMAFIIAGIRAPTRSRMALPEPSSWEATTCNK